MSKQPTDSPKPTLRSTKDRALKCELTLDQIREYGELLAANQQRVTELENEKADWVKAWKRRYTSVQCEADGNGAVIRQKYEVRDIPCETVMDYQAQTVHVVRLDTNETVEDRRMTNDELSNLPL